MKVTVSHGISGLRAGEYKCNLPNILFYYYLKVNTLQLLNTKGSDSTKTQDSASPEGKRPKTPT